MPAPPTSTVLTGAALYVPKIVAVLRAARAFVFAGEKHVERVAGLHFALEIDVGEVEQSVGI